tara:strand:+ start:1455 stop:3194 length:1740 start_codon:yes stop_codon:yes gene_type:complete
LSETTKIITKSPRILSSNNNYVQDLEKDVNNKYNEIYRNKSKEYTYEIYNSLKKEKNISEYSLLCSQKFLKFYNQIYFASLFSDSFLGREFWVIKPICKDKKINYAISSDIYNILELHPNCKIKEIPVNSTNERSARGDSKVSLYSRLRIVGYKGIFWNFLNLISFLFKSNKVKIAIISSNELVRDISFYLLWRKNLNIFYFKKFFNFKNKIVIIKNENIIKNISVIVNKIFLKALRDVPSETIRELLIAKWNIELIDIINSYRTYKHNIKNILDKKKIDFILIGYLDMLKGLALHNICQNKSIPLISCQHGITREIIFDPNMRSIFFETSFSDYLFCYNDMSKKVTQSAMYYNQNNIYNIGLPSDYRNFISKKNKSKEICYISTILLSGGIPNFIAPEKDIELINWELKLINKVFKKTIKTIDYKPYPAIRYAENDISIQAVKEDNNLKLVGTHIDLRYIISNYGLLITSGATSTLGWCVQSNIPLIIINRKGSLSIKESVIHDFKKAFFIFDDSDENWTEKLKSFLEKEYSDILKLWRNKLDTRPAIIKKYFGDVNLNAGKNGANIINNIIREQKFG